VGAALRIAGKDLRLRVRDRSVFILGIIAPLTLAFIFNFVFGGALGGTGLGLEFGMVDMDQSEISTALTQALRGAESEEILTLDTFDTREAAEAAIEDGEIDAYFFIPPGLSQAVVSNQATTIEVVGDVDAPTSTQVAASFAERFSAGVETSQLAIVTTAQVAGVPVGPDLISSLSQDPAAAAGTFQLTDTSAETKQLDAATYFAAGMAVFFLFFTVQFGVAGLLEEEREGTLARLMAAPIPRMSVIAGKGILSFVLGMVSMGVLIVATALLMGADWGAPLGVAILVAAGVLSAVGIIGLVASVAKSPEGASNLGSIIAVILGLLGGTFFPIGTAGSFLSKLTYITPHAWFLRGLGDLTSGAPWTAALPAAGAIMVFALVTGTIAALLMRRRWAR
jgi:linearmycin/streptolysin S transport system permease protein